MNLVLLKAFLDVKGKRGVMITIDRPHQYVSHLMQLHGIDQTNLTFLDAISAHSADAKAGAVAPEFQHGPFHIETLPEFLTRKGDHGSAVVVDLSSVDFVIIDNISVLLTYNSKESVRKFLHNYGEAVAAAKPVGLQTLVVMDGQQHPELYGVVAALSKSCIDLGQDMTVKGVSVGGVSIPIPGAATGVPHKGIGELGQSMFRSKE